MIGKVQESFLNRLNTSTKRYGLNVYLIEGEVDAMAYFLGKVAANYIEADKFAVYAWEGVIALSTGSGMYRLLCTVFESASTD